MPKLARYLRFSGQAEEETAEMDCALRAAQIPSQSLKYNNRLEGV